MSLFEVTKQASILVDQVSKQRARTKYSVLASAMAELAECAEEIAISEKHSYKEQGKDRIISEAVDTILCLLDLIHVVDPTITEEQLTLIAYLNAIDGLQKYRKYKTMVGGATSDTHGGNLFKMTLEKDQEHKWQSKEN